MAASVSRSLAAILALSMFVSGALSFGIPAEFVATKSDLSFQSGVLRLVRDGNTACDSGGEAGVCYNPLNCLRVAGVFGNNCPGSQGVCCLFYRQCNQESSQEVSYFRNTNERAGPSCNYRVVKRSANHCGMRIKLEQLELAADCQSKIHIEGIRQGRSIGRLRFPERNDADVICSTEVGNEYAFDARNIEEVRLNVESSTGNSGKWKIKVTQVHCRDDDHDSHIPAVWPPPLPTHPPSHTHPTHPPSATRPPTTSRPTTARPPTSATCWWNCQPATSRPTPRPTRPTTTKRPKVPDQQNSAKYAACGVKGPNTGEAKFRESNNDVGGESKPFIQDMTWGNPARNESDHVQILNRLIEEDPFIALASGRVTFGKDSGPQEYPWQVGMKVRGRFHCGASIISDQHILTAAHCVTKYKRTPTSLYLTLGDYDLSNAHEQANYVPTVERVIVHPQYSRTTLRNDLAVLKLTKKIPFRKNIRPICLAPAGFDPTGKIAIVTGWGRNENNRLQSKLQELASEVDTNAYCGGQWEKNGAPRGFITKDMMCMSPIGGDSCNGDSGGPSVMEIGGTYYQIGIVSFGSGSCVDETLPGVYTRVTSYRDWIIQQMK